jgi:superfamily I DNA and RNA helicase
MRGLWFGWGTTMILSLKLKAIRHILSNKQIGITTFRETMAKLSKMRECKFCTQLFSFCLKM